MLYTGRERIPYHLGIQKGRRNTCSDYPRSTSLTFEGTVIVRITAKHKLHDRVSHVVVVITRNTVSCVYYTDNGEDAIGRFTKRAVAASENKIEDNNANGIRNRYKTDHHERPRRKLETVNRRCGLLTPP
ncbi:hypothetical protein EVAR_90394_1 [Eumeta japonica]|uniref:Uncharacterized protein n=1 Tax=Eumeta variegata TaxID=151549 RepID=A0A4C1ZT85_EUMVA|nr:hypothetical protein EVAR_90394_1 [Eumeta japonica]